MSAIWFPASRRYLHERQANSAPQLANHQRHDRCRKTDFGDPQANARQTNPGENQKAADHAAESARAMNVPALFPHQEKAALRMAKGEPVYLGFDMGIGKSRTFIEAANRRGARRILILCPASARLVWRQEILRWAPGSGCVIVTKPVELNSDARFVIITHGLLSQREGTVARALVSCKPFEMTALDEAHGFNSIDTLRITALRRALLRLGYIVPLSGTPIRNHAGDLYNMLAICWPEGLQLPSGHTMTRYDFESQFCRVAIKHFNNRQVRVIEGSKN